MRLGLHRMTGAFDEDFKEYVSIVKPPWVKMLDEWPEELIDFCHTYGTKVIGRVYFTVGEQNISGANTSIATVTAKARAHPKVDAWELWNETHQTTEYAPIYASISIDFAKAINALGRTAVIGSFSTGQPEMEYWQGYRPALLMAARSGGQVMLGLHEYGGDRLFEGVEDGLGWWILRYRRHRKIWDDLQVGEVQVLITESGKDNIHPDGKGGWRNRPGDYAQEMRDYCLSLTQDSYIKGIVDFGWATADPAWDSFDLSQNKGVFQQMIAEMKDLPRGSELPPEEPTMPPIQRIKPYVFSSRLGYRPRYVVLHSAAGGEGLTTQRLAQYLSRNSAGASAHYAVGEGEIYGIVDEGDAAHHAGGSTLPDGTHGSYTSGKSWVDAVNAVSIGVEMIQVAGKATPPGVVNTAAALVADVCRRHGIPVNRVVGHREISGPGGHVDPVGVAMDAFRKTVGALIGGAVVTPPPTDGVSEALKAEARKRIILSANSGAALYRAILAAGCIPVSCEFDFPPDLVAQVGYSQKGTFLFTVHKGRWADVQRTTL